MTYLLISLAIFLIVASIVRSLDSDMDAPIWVYVLVAVESLLWPIAAIGIGVAAVIAALFLVRLKKNDEQSSEVFNDRYTP